MPEVLLQLSYKGPIQSWLDDLLEAIGERAGFDWYASGTDLETGRRDLSFLAVIAEQGSPEAVELIKQA